ncbi:nucleolar protein dao-5-like [Dermacentor albipictus]|uniref:nucleolar protein dao-5-like n=1 Tax=Dermacentor albipictus TaxID=60249 RepID=UPI0038FC967A
MEVRKPREASIQSTATTPRSQSAKKGTLSKSPERSRPRKVGEGATKSHEERKDSPGTMRAGSQSPASEGRSSRVTEERSPGCNSDKRSATATPTPALSRGSPPPTGDPKSPLAKTGGPRTAKSDNARSRGKSSSRDVPVASLSRTGTQGPAPTSFVTAHSKKYGNEKGVSRSPGRTRGATAATSLPRSTEQCPAGGTPTVPTVATEFLHSKPRCTEGSKSRGRGLSTVSPRGVSSKQGSHDSREPQAALATSRSARGNQKSRDAKPTSTSPRRSVVGKGQVTGGRSSSQDAKPASSTPVRKDR